MRKLLFQTIFLLGFFVLIPNTTFAISGACSSHGGVDCSYGPGSSGNAMCKDGSQSSTSYYSTETCNATCSIPVIQDCDANMLGVITIQQNRSGMGNQIYGQQKIQECKDRHLQYQSQIIQYNSCVATMGSYSKKYKSPDTQLDKDFQEYLQYSDKNKACKNSDSNSLYYSKTDKCICKYDHTLDDYGKCSCPANSYESGNGGCYANPGYVNIGNNKYITEKESLDNECKKTFGINSITSDKGKGYCSCISDYHFDGSPIFCQPNKVDIVTTSASSTTEVKKQPEKLLKPFKNKSDVENVKQNTPILKSDNSENISNTSKPSFFKRLSNFFRKLW